YQESGAWRVGPALGKARLPERIQGVILSRIDRLAPALKNVLQHAAVIGRVFPRRLLERTVDSGQWLVVGEDRESGSTSSKLTTNHDPLSTALNELEER